MHVDRGGDVEVVEGLAVAGARGALLEQRAELAHVLGREQRRDPAVGDLGGERGVLRPDRREVDRDPLLHRRDRELQRLARPVGQRQLERLALELEALARERHPHHRDVLARARELAAEALAVPALGDLRAARADAEQHPAAGELVDRRRGHRRHRGRAAGHLEDRGAELDPRRRLREPGEDRGGVGAVGLGGPHRVVAEPLGLEHDRELLRAVSRAPSSRCAGRVASSFRRLPPRPPVAYGAPRAGGADPIGRFRTAIDCLRRGRARRCSRASAAKPVVVGAYTDNKGGVCPMLAAHRHGGRTSFVSFARAWDDFARKGRSVAPPAGTPRLEDLLDARSRRRSGPTSGRRSPSTAPPSADGCRRPMITTRRPRGRARRRAARPSSRRSCCSRWNRASPETPRTARGAPSSTSASTSSPAPTREPPTHTASVARSFGPRVKNPSCTRGRHQHGLDVPRP